MNIMIEMYCDGKETHDEFVAALDVLKIRLENKYQKWEDEQSVRVSRVSSDGSIEPVNKTDVILKVQIETFESKNIQSERQGENNG